MITSLTLWTWFCPACGAITDLIGPRRGPCRASKCHPRYLCT